MSEKKIVDYWVKSAQEDLLTAQSLLETKRYFHSLFFCHLFLEKILKAIYIFKNHIAPPWTHDLLKLVHESNVDLPEKFKNDLREISRFNIQARYNDYKFSLYKKATREFSTSWFQKAQDIYLWIKKEL